MVLATMKVFIDLFE